MEETELKAKRLAIVKDTVAHYTGKNRGTNGSYCQYSPIIGRTEGCAIGRLITDKRLCTEFDSFGGSLKAPSIQQKLPIELVELGLDFLYDLQRLHDRENNWTEAGLSSKGEYSADELIVNYCK